MLSQRTIEISVGLFLLAALAALLVLAFRVSGLTSFFKVDSYQITAQFDDIGQLKARSAVKIDGVNIGEVTNIRLDSTNFRAVVTMDIYSDYKNLPSDSSAAILTAGLLGDNYVAITPMYSQTFLQNGSEISNTHSAMILEKLIGQFMFNVNKSKNSEKPAAAH